MTFKSVKTHVYKQGVDCIIVLGGGYGGSCVKRVLEGVKLFKQGFGKKLLLSGGLTKDGSISEAEFMKKIAIKQGVSDKNILLEDKSLDTIGNAVFTKKIFKKKKYKTLLLVTSDFHLERSLYIFHYVFGTEYRIFGFDVQTSFTQKFLLQKEKKEQKYLLETQTLFSGIKKGDDKTVLKRLQKIHPYYRKGRELGSNNWFMKFFK